MTTIEIVVRSVCFGLVLLSCTLGIIGILHIPKIEVDPNEKHLDGLDLGD